MTYLPLNKTPVSPMLSCVSVESLGVTINATSNSGVSSASAYPTTNMAIFIPFSLRSSVRVYGLFTANSTTAGNSFDIGVYTTDGTKVISTGPTAQVGTSVVQVVTITPITIGPGSFYLAIAANGTTGKYLSASITAKYMHICGILQQTTAFPLPQNAVFATTTTNTIIPTFGILTTSTLATGVPILFVNVNDKTITSENIVA